MKPHSNLLLLSFFMTVYRHRGSTREPPSHDLPMQPYASTAMPMQPYARPTTLRCPDRSEGPVHLGGPQGAARRRRRGGGCGAVNLTYLAELQLPSRSAVIEQPRRVLILPVYLGLLPRRGQTATRQSALRASENREHAIHASRATTTCDIQPTPRLTTRA
jgi:hypothetical protein